MRTLGAPVPPPASGGRRGARAAARPCCGLVRAPRVTAARNRHGVYLLGCLLRVPAGARRSEDPLRVAGAQPVGGLAGRDGLADKADVGDHRFDSGPRGFGDHLPPVGDWRQCRWKPWVALRPDGASAALRLPGPSHTPAAVDLRESLAGAGLGVGAGDVVADESGQPDRGVDVAVAVILRQLPRVQFVQFPLDTETASLGASTQLFPAVPPPVGR